MKPYSKGLRLRVLAAVDRGMPQQDVAEVFGVSIPSIKRWLNRRRETGDVQPRPIPGPPARKREALEAALPEQVRLNPDLTLEERCELFEEVHSVKVCNASMSRAFKRLELPLKKCLVATERDKERWREQVGRLDPRRLVFVDECAIHTSMTRRYGRAPRGERAYGSVPRNRGKNTTLLASMTESGMGEAMAIEDSTTTRVFEAYVERFLVANLQEGQVVILDNLGAHKSEKVRELIEARGCKLIFLPAYWLDFNPSILLRNLYENVKPQIGSRMWFH